MIRWMHTMADNLLHIFILTGFNIWQWLTLYTNGLCEYIILHVCVAAMCLYFEILPFYSFFLDLFTLPTLYFIVSGFQEGLSASNILAAPPRKSPSSTVYFTWEIRLRSSIIRLELLTSCRYRYDQTD